MNHCINCKHFVPNQNSIPSFGLCGLSDGVSTGAYQDWLVAGEGEAPTRMMFCSVMRMNGQRCDEEGKLFEAKA